jgi:trehalose 2-sulfotransferase
MSAIERAYLVCATPRSGSTLLCELLKATGVAGCPQEFFETLRSTGYPRQPRQYFDGAPEVQALLEPVDPGVPETAFDWDGVLRAGTTPNAVFAAKVMWGHLDDLWARLDGRSLDDVLPRLRYVRVSRADRVAQAVSLWVAIQTQRWRDEGDKEETHDPVYSNAAIRHLVEQLAAHERAWDVWLADRDPIVVPYEELAADPAGSVGAVLAELGIPAEVPNVSRMRRQSGDRSREWIERYVQEEEAVA